ncbi:MAG: NADH-quinone oxidoreductase subunit C, partial [Planctomycetota bacterium]
MTPAEIVQAYQTRFESRVVASETEGIHPYVKVEAGAWLEAATMAKDELGCEVLHDLTASDGESTMTVLAHLWSFSHRHWINLKADVDRADPRIASLQPLWNAADWHERECYDMFGVVFEGHPSLRRILCPEDWEGFPLRKDYEMPDYYHGIPGIPVLLKR